MSIDLKKVLPSILRAVGKVIPGVGIAADAVADALEPDKLTPEQAAALDAHILEMTKLDVSVIQADDEVEKAELASDHWFVWGARPFLLYLAGLGTGALVVAVIAQIKVDTGAVAELMIPLWGHAGFYGYQRTREKLARA